MRKSKLALSTFGVILGIAGIEHGIGEILQGSAKPSSMVFESWPNSEVYEVLAGEPAFTIFTNLSFSILGSLAILFSALIIFCSIAMLGRKKFAGILFFFLTVNLFLFGAGMAGPILMGIPISILSTFLRRSLKTKDKSSTKLKIIKSSFNVMYILSIVSWFSLWPGLVIVSSFYKFSDGESSIVYILAAISFISFIFSIIFGFAYDKSKIKE